MDFPQPLAYALPLGLGAHGGEGPKPYRVDFAPGEQLLLYTDGVTEARDADGSSTRSASGRTCSRSPTRGRPWRGCARTWCGTPQARSHDDAAMLLLRYPRSWEGKICSHA